MAAILFFSSISYTCADFIEFFFAVIEIILACKLIDHSYGSNIKVVMRKILVFLLFILVAPAGKSQSIAYMPPGDRTDEKSAVLKSDTDSYKFKLDLIPDYQTSCLTATYSLPWKETLVKLSLYSGTGRLIKNKEAEYQGRGEYMYDFDLRNLKEGNYLVWLTAHNDNIVIKFIVPPGFKASR
jgi:hypothetical protein